MDTAPPPPPHDRRGESQEEERAPGSEPLARGTGRCWSREETDSGALSKRGKKRKRGEGPAIRPPQSCRVQERP